MVTVSSWGRVNSAEHQVVKLNNSHEVVRQIHGQPLGIAYGMGRSYGDICLNPGGVLWDTSGLNRFISFDADLGILRCEAGVLLQDIQRLMISRGFMLAVTPGTQLVTLGGAIANDIHGKNHHKQGSFAHHVTWLKLIRTDGQIIECGPYQHQQWFTSTIGGMGLTGVITEVEIKLQRVNSPWLIAETIAYTKLTDFFSLADESADFDYTVAWIDCLQQKSCRGLFMRANAVPTIMLEKPLPTQKKMTIPLTPPISLVNQLTLRPFNMLYFYGKKWRTGKKIIHYESFFYPLDNIDKWNRLYGPKGFFQYQSVLPHAVREEAMQAMLHEISRAKMGSFLAVLKTFGEQSSLGLMSFPLAKGVTLALDFPNQGEKTLALFNRLDAIVREACGRIYLAKDACMSRDLFVSGYSHLNTFLQYRDPGMSSAMSRRLIGI